MVLEELKTFCVETSIHGLDQVVNDRTHALKRLLWFGIFAGSLAYAGQLLSSSIKGICYVFFPPIISNKYLDCVFAMSARA